MGQLAFASKAMKVKNKIKETKRECENDPVCNKTLQSAKKFVTSKMQLSSFSDSDQLHNNTAQDIGW